MPPTFKKKVYEYLSDARPFLACTIDSKRFGYTKAPARLVQLLYLSIHFFVLMGGWMLKLFQELQLTAILKTV